MLFFLVVVFFVFVLFIDGCFFLLFLFLRVGCFFISCFGKGGAISYQVMKIVPLEKLVLMAD